ncbi:hypothetical protein VHEMI04726 [[Torrubiella] hemipterigena]|uniref:Domain of unknown function at the cortex 1 domain-containing protein n=1 Tax=[Torrubiella] hemipterigena TaxID=1531966 RepID=A0A0A1TF58_9HYPO|nr:hypothetical protein VHEMI04726 [[Torrubiella] hemipterigena]
MSEKYVLRISAGSSYDESDHVVVPINSVDPISIKGDKGDIELNVRIQGYNGLPINSPDTSPYFSTEPHAYNQDQYSISLRFTPHKSASAGADDAGINGNDLQFGNDFDRPIRDRLPPGFNTALSIVKWWIDPGLDGDAYADKPYLYGPALSSFNVMHVGQGELDKEKGGLWFEEGGDEEGQKARDEVGMPVTGKARMKWALTDANKEKWTFEYGKTYGFDFFNPYIDFAKLALKLPGFQLSLASYWDGQPVRYVLRNKSTEEVYMVIVFTLFLKEDINENGSIKEGAEQRIAESVGAVEHEEHDEEEALKKAREELGTPPHETSTDDVD